MIMKSNIMIMRGRQTNKWRCIKAKRTLSLWNNLLTIVGLLGLFFLVFAYLINKSIIILMFGQITSIISMGAAFFFSYMILLKGIKRNLTITLIMLGSLGDSIGRLSQLAQGNILNTEPLIQVATILIAVGIILFLNSIYRHGNCLEGDNTIDDE